VDCCSIQFPAAAYPEILLQLLKQKHLIKSIAFYNKDEKFWLGYWGKKLNEPDLNEANIRIFVVKNASQLKELYDAVLIEHANKYKVLVINENIVRKEIRCSRDFVIIEDKGEKIVGEYTTEDGRRNIEYENDVTEIIGKKVRFSLNDNEIKNKCSLFEQIRKRAIVVEKDIEYVELKQSIFGKKL
jgi:hypothetical protein